MLTRTNAEVAVTIMLLISVSLVPYYVRDAPK